MRLAGFGATFVVTFSVIGAGWTLSAGAEMTPVGATIYAENCAGCHGLQLGGSSGPAIGPALKGADFVDRWGKVSAADFASFVRSTMPLNMPGSLDEASSTAAANYVLAANGLGTSSAPAVAQTPSPQAAEMMTVVTASEDLDAGYHAAMEARAARIRRIRPVDDAMLSAPPREDWLSWRGTSATQGFSPIDQIDRANAEKLGLAWSLSLAPGTNGIAPIVHDGVLFINSNGTVQALDARNGDVIWRFERPARTSRVPSSQPRGIALYGDALYVPTVDNHVLALDAKTGKLLWDHVIGKPEDRLQLTAAPMVVRGKVIQGVSGCQGSELGGGCYIVALDAKTGEEAWRFHTIARPGQPGGDSWNGAPVDKRYGGSVWVTGSYDAALNLFLVGVGQTYTISTLLDPQARKGTSNDALFTNATLAIDPDNGKLVWHYQHESAEVWDLDWAFERTVLTVDDPREPRKIIVTGGKAGIFDALDAKTGKYLWSRDLGLQNLITAIDPKTGRKTHDPAMIPEVGKPKLICPSSMGNRSWMSTAYDPATRLLYVPLSLACMEYSRAETRGAAGAYGELVIHRRRRPDSDGNQGQLAAIDVANGRIAWVQKRRAAQASAVLTTGGGLVFEGGHDRVFRALDSRSGDTLWQTLLPATPNAFPFSYMVDAIQYVGIVTGGGTGADAGQVPMTPEHPASNGAKTIMVFALPASARQQGARSQGN